MEGDTVMISLLTLFFGIFALQSLYTPTDAGILLRIGGMFGFQTTTSTPFLWVVVIVVAIVIVVNFSFLVNLITIGMDTIVLSLLTCFVGIFVLQTRESGTLISIGGMFGLWSVPSAPNLWAVLIVIVLVAITRGGR